MSTIPKLCFSERRTAKQLGVSVEKLQEGIKEGHIYPDLKAISSTRCGYLFFLEALTKGEILVPKTPMKVYFGTKAIGLQKTKSADFYSSTGSKIVYYYIPYKQSLIPPPPSLPTAQ